MSDAEKNHRWRETRNLAGITLGASAFLIIVMVAVAAPGADTGGYPIGLVLATAVLPFLLVLAVFWFIHRQTMIDRRHGLFED